MNLANLPIAFALCLFVAILGALELGRRVRERRHRVDPDGTIGGGTVDGGVLALLGLLLAFSFTGAATRFDTRRHLAVEEANAVGTAWLRVDLLPADAQPAVRDAMRAYVDARMRVHRALPDIAAAGAAHREAAVFQERVWSLARTAAERDGRPNVTMLVLPALNAMFDIGTSRAAALRTSRRPSFCSSSWPRFSPRSCRVTACGRPGGGTGCTSSCSRR